MTGRPPLAACALALGLAACGDRFRVEPPPAPPAEPAGYLGPTLTLEAPARGAMFDLAGPEGGALALAGQACDAAHVLVLAKVEGTPVELSGAGACRTFSASVSPRVGLEVVRGEVVNDAGQRGTLVQAVLSAPAWFDADGPGSHAPSALLLRLGQEFLDDGDRSTANDVATLVQSVLAAQDLDAAVGAQRVASPDANGDGSVDTRRYSCALYTVTNRRTGYAAWKDGPLTHRGIAVESIALEDGGLAARIVVSGLRLPFGVTGYLDSGCLGDAQDTVHGDVTVGAVVVVAHAAVTQGAAGPELAVTRTSATLQDLDIDIALGRLVDWTGLGSVIGDGVESVVRGPIQGAIRDGLREALQERLARLLPALGAIGGAFALPEALGGGALALETGLDLADFTAERALVGLRVRVRPADGAAIAHAAARGAMRLGGALPGDAPLAGEALAVGLSDDALNQLLHAAWQAGAFDRKALAIDAGLEGSEGLRATVDLTAALPPVVMPRSGGAAGVDVAWGDLGFDVALEGPRGTARVKGWISVVIGLDGLGVNPVAGTFRPAFSGAPEVNVQVTSVDWDDLPVSRGLTEGLVAGILRSKLAELLGEAIGSTPLPVIDLGALDPSLPSVRVALSWPRDLRLGRYALVAGGVAAVP